MGIDKLTDKALSDIEAFARAEITASGGAAARAVDRATNTLAFVAEYRVLRARCEQLLLDAECACERRPEAKPDCDCDGCETARERRLNG